MTQQQLQERRERLYEQRRIARETKIKALTKYRQDREREFFDNPAAVRDWVDFLNGGKK